MEFKKFAEMKKNYQTVKGKDVLPSDKKKYVFDFSFLNAVSFEDGTAFSREVKDSLIQYYLEKDLSYCCYTDFGFATACDTNGYRYQSDLQFEITRVYDENMNRLQYVFYKLVGVHLIRCIDYDYTDNHECYAGTLYLHSTPPVAEAKIVA